MDVISEQFPMTLEQAVEWARGQSDRQNLVKACYWDDPLLQAAERFHQSEEWKETRKRFSATTGKALELGAGRGIASYALAKEGFEVTALEPDPSNLIGCGAIQRLAKESGLPISVTQEWGEHLPFPDHSFDLVYARQMLHHAHNLPDLCREAARVLKPSGLFIAVREPVVDSAEDLHIFFRGNPLHHLYGGENAFSLPYYINAVSGAGLYFREILPHFDNVINFYPRDEDEKIEFLKTLWRWPGTPTPAELVENARQTFRGPGRLYTFVATAKVSSFKKPGGTEDGQFPHSLIVLQALHDLTNSGLDEANQRLAKIERQYPAKIEHQAKIEERLSKIERGYQAIMEEPFPTKIEERLSKIEERLSRHNARYWKLRHPIRSFFRKLRAKLSESK